MNLSLVKVTDATVEPVTLAQAKLHLRILDSDTSQDTYITSLITAARTHAENVCNRAFIEQTWRLNLDYFPYYGDAYTRPNRGNNYLAQVIGLWSEAMTLRIPVPRLMDIESITYIDANDETQTVDSTTYVVDSDSEPARVCPTPGSYWPYPQLYRPNSVTITFTCGYGPDATTVPLSIQQAILLLISHWFWNRDAVIPGQAMVLPLAVDALLAPYIFQSFEFN